MWRVWREERNGWIESPSVFLQSLGMGSSFGGADYLFFGDHDFWEKTSFSTFQFFMRSSIFILYCVTVLESIQRYCRNAGVPLSRVLHLPWEVYVFSSSPSCFPDHFCFFTPASLIMHPAPYSFLSDESGILSSIIYTENRTMKWKELV